MTDLRSMCASVRQAKDEMEKAKEKYLDEVTQAGWVLMKECPEAVQEYLERNPGVVFGIVRMLDR